MKLLLLAIPHLFGVVAEEYFVIAFLTVSCFFLWRRLLSKKSKSRSGVALLTGLVALCTVLLVYFAAFLVWVSVVSYYPRNAFNQSVWFANKKKRYEFSADLIESRRLIGKTKSQVKQLLGDEQNNESSDNWTYYLGYKPSLFGIDPDVLDIRFEHGRVVEVSQRET
jgi:hypothetical protein